MLGVIIRISIKLSVSMLNVITLNFAFLLLSVFMLRVILPKVIALSSY
jgi:hypothetical protein